MTHIDDLITDYLDNTLDAVTRDRVKSHLVFCVDCQNKINETSQIIKALHNTTKTEVPAGLEAKIMARLNSKEEAPKSSGFFESFMSMFHWRVLALGMASFVGVMIVFRMKNNSDSADRKVPESPIAFLQKSSDARQTVGGERKHVSDQIGEKAPARRWNNQYAGRESEGRISGKDEAGAIKQTAPLSESPLGKGSSEIRTDNKPASRVEEMDMRDGATVPKSLNVKNDKPAAHFVGQKVIRDERELNALLTQLGLEPFPVDFTEEDVLAIVLPTEPSAGTIVSLTLIEQSMIGGVETRIVTYSVVPPEGGMVYATVMTTPHLLKAVPKFAGKTVFRKIP